MTVLTSGISFADLEFQGLRRIIATAALSGSDGIAIVDPGPSTTLPTLRRHLESMGATVQDIAALLLTHIHLDHAGASGTLLRENPRIRVYVHEVGVPHLIDPAKLLASAGRLYAGDMERLWGEVLPVASSAIVALAGGEHINIGGRSWEVAYTPGHASHHVSFFSDAAGIAFVGDTAGVRVLRDGFILPPTPPPDIDIPLWMTSLEAIERWQPETLFLTHFGPSNGVTAHLAELRDHLQMSERFGREALASGDDESAREQWFVTRVRREMGRHLEESDVRGYEAAGRLDLNWRGIARYLTKRAKG